MAFTAQVFVVVLLELNRQERLPQMEATRRGAGGWKVKEPTPRVRAHTSGIGAHQCVSHFTVPRGIIRAGRGRAAAGPL